MTDRFWERPIPDDWAMARMSMFQQFPWVAHRTMAEVRETEALEAKAETKKLTPYELMRLRELKQREVAPHER